MTRLADAEHWAGPVRRLHASDAPPEAIHLLNIDGRQVISPLQGFGQMWKKTYRVRLPGLGLSAKQVMDIWKLEFPQFQPPASRFHPPAAGIQPGSIIFIDLDLPPAPGLPDMIPVASGLLVVYADDEMFTVMTPEGFPVSGWNTFSVHEQDGRLVAQVQSLERATDPIYELGSLLLGGAARQEENWLYVLEHLSTRFGIQGQVQMHKELVDPRWQWSEAANILKNAMLRTVLYRLAAQARQAQRLLSRHGRASGRRQAWRDQQPARQNAAGPAQRDQPGRTARALAVGLAAGAALLLLVLAAWQANRQAAKPVPGASQ